MRELGRSARFVRLDIRDDDSAEVAKLITFLASDDASLVTGSEYLIDGGALLMGNQDLILSIMESEYRQSSGLRCGRAGQNPA